MRRVNFTITIALLSGIISALAADAIAQDNRPMSPKSKVEKALEQKTSCSFQDEPLADVLDFFRAMSGISILVDENLGQAVEKNTVSLEASELPMREILMLVLEPCDLTFMVMDDCIFISTKEEIAQRRREEMLESLRVFLDFQETPPYDVIEFIRQVSRTKVVVDPDILDSLGKATVMMKDVLDLILTTHGLDYSVEEDCIFISSIEKIAERKRQAKIEKVQSRLRNIKVDVAMTSVPVIDVLRLLQELTDKDIRWDVSLTPTYSERLISVNLKKTPLLDALKTILDPVGCYYRVGEEGIFIGQLSDAPASDNLSEKRGYNLSIMDIEAKSQDVIELLTVTFPDLEGKIQYDESTNSLIIEATSERHRKIERFFVHLRGAQPNALPEEEEK